MFIFKFERNGFKKYKMLNKLKSLFSHIFKKFEKIKATEKNKSREIVYCNRFQGRSQDFERAGED